jgi:hypothetical protein
MDVISMSLPMLMIIIGLVYFAIGSGSALATSQKYKWGMFSFLVIVALFLTMQKSSYSPGQSTGMTRGGFHFNTTSTDYEGHHSVPQLFNQSGGTFELDDLDDPSTI